MERSMFERRRSRPRRRTRAALHRPRADDDRLPRPHRLTAPSGRRPLVGANDRDPHAVADPRRQGDELPRRPRGHGSLARRPGRRAGVAAALAAVRGVPRRRGVIRALHRPIEGADRPSAPPGSDDRDPFGVVSVGSRHRRLGDCHRSRGRAGASGRPADEVDDRCRRLRRGRWR